MILKGGHRVEAGTYINTNDGARISVAEGGVLPGDGTSMYMKMSHAITFAGLAALLVVMSMAFPMGIGVLLMVFAVAAIGAIGLVGYICVKLAGEFFGKSASFGWSPSAAYLAGKKTRREKKDETEDKK